ncbi:MAG: aminotransferase class V-fold PLP-dependent enzyme [Peptostreptococcaceae bacterium]
MKYSFKNDYSEGCHKSILESLLKNNETQENGYGEDDFCDMARVLINEKINKNSDIHFVSGGTQANLIMISSMLKPYESVICANTGHINVHETGAIEATGHKVCPIDTINGKLTVSHVKKVLDSHSSEHMVSPKLVYISNSTELGTIYTKQEMKDLYDFCRENDLYMHIDGARLGSALMSRDSDFTLEDVSNSCDMFYIGGTKNGALLGEAIVINNENLSKNFRFYIKQRGALLAKGRLIGTQFVELFKNNVFEECGLHANKMSYKLEEGLKDLGYKLLAKVQSNLIFIEVNKNELEKIQKDYNVSVEHKVDEENYCVRLVTSFMTKEEKVDEFLKDLQNIKNN